MKIERRIHITLAMLMFIASGCASANVNPARARANTGYVDLYSTTDAELCWDVRVADAPGDRFRTIFSDVKPVPGDVLRLAFTPGHHWLRVTFLNRVVKEPVDVEVVVEDGKIMPVRITLTEISPTTVLSRQTTMGGTPAGRGGRRTRINSDETVMFVLSAMTGRPVPFQPKQQMPYSTQPK
jgi:hypothetical protein